MLFKDIKNTDIKFNEKVESISKNQDLFFVNTTNFKFMSKSIIIASGGISYPNLEVSNIGHIVAKSFGHKIIPVRPALCAIKTKYFDTSLSGISLPVQIKTNDRIITDNLLFTHFGLGGPAIYRASLSLGKFIINFAPDIDLFTILKDLKNTEGKKSLSTVLSRFIPNKLANVFAEIHTGNIADIKDKDLKILTNKIHNFEIIDYELIGMQSAEITFGGIDTKDISSKTMESKLCPGLFFAGEVIDVNGDLGGFNLQWAFSSGYVAGLNA